MLSIYSINTEIEPKNPYLSALILFRQKLCNTIISIDSKTIQNQERKTGINLLLKGSLTNLYYNKIQEFYETKNNLITFTLSENPEIVETAFKKYQTNLYNSTDVHRAIDSKYNKTYKTENSRNIEFLKVLKDIDEAFCNVISQNEFDKEIIVDTDYMEKATKLTLSSLKII